MRQGELSFTAPAPVVVAATTLQPTHDAHSGRVCDSQLVDSMLGPLLHAKETGKKPSVNDLGSVG